MSDILAKLASVLEERKAGLDEGSYVSGLYKKGTDAILKKIGEEATELLVAAKNDSRAEIVHETADLWFHSMVLLAAKGLRPEEVLQELERRFGRSGLQEKADRSN
jgi:phosphoribosyl-ATP pyrophosphohydrolase